MKNGWETKELEDACEVEYGTRVVNKKDGGTIYPVYGGGGATFSIDKYNREECLVIARFAMSEQCTRFIKGKFFLNDSGLTVRSRNTKELLQSFLDLQILYLNDHIYSLARGTAQKNLDVPAFRSIEINFPKYLPEQQRIVSILDEAFAAIDKAKANAERNLKNAKELFETYSQGMFETKGEGWEEKTLGEVCSLITDGKHGDCENETNSGYYFLSAKDVRNNTLLFENARQITKSGFEETHRRTNLKPGDICMVNTGATIGRISFAPDDPRTLKTTFQKSVAVIKTVPSLINNQYCCYLLKSDLNKLMKVSSGTAVPNLLLGDLKRHKINLPKSLSEQRSIVKQFDELSTGTKKLESNYERKISKQWGKTKFNPDLNDPTIKTKHPQHAKGGCSLDGNIFRAMPNSKTIKNNSRKLA
jgi:type I restriction enzyme S subunit